VAEIDYPKHGKRLKVHGSPWQFSETPARIGIAPELGGDNDAVLAGLGYSPAQIAEFGNERLFDARMGDGRMGAMKRQMHLNLFFHSRGHHEASWRIRLPRPWH